MSFVERLKTAASAEWRAYTEHPFTNGLADGSLAEAAFRHYLVQDYLFLIEFARAYALSVYKSPKLADMREAAAGVMWPGWPMFTHRRMFCSIASKFGSDFQYGLSARPL